MNGKEVQTLGKPPPLLSSCRLVLTLMILTGSFNLFCMRMNLSFALICMVQPAPRNSSAPQKNDSCHPPVENVEKESSGLLEYSLVTNSSQEYQHEGTFDWSRELQGHLLGAYFWGYMVTQLVGGLVSDRTSGGKMLTITGMAVYACLTLLTPLVANFSVELFIGLRFLQGVSSGLSLPSFHVLISRWVPDAERGTLTCLAFSGFSIAACLTYPISSFLCQYGFAGGWPSVFYVTGVMGVLWCIVCFWTIYDTPLSHPRISEEELEYLRHLVPIQKDASTGKVKKTPWLQLFTAAPILAYIVTHFCNNWGYYTIIINLPIFMKEVYNFNITDNGLLSAVPYLAALSVRFTIGPLFDFIRNKQVTSVTCLRKIFNSIGMFLPAIAMFFIGFLTCAQRYGAVILLAFCSGVNEVAFSAGYLFSGMEMAPHYIGVLTGVANTIATTPGFISPLVAAALTPNRTREEWLSVFYITSAVQLVGALVFLAFGSSEKLVFTSSEKLPVKEAESLVEKGH